jgi:mitofilin
MRAASELVLLPAGSGGVVAHLLAKAARLLRVDEAGAVAALGTEEGGAQARLAAAERLAAAGQYREASQHLVAATSGSRAEEVVQQWVAQARARALADQALQLLQARAATLAASLAA